MAAIIVCGMKSTPGRRSGRRSRATRTTPALRTAEACSRWAEARVTEGAPTGGVCATPRVRDDGGFRR